MSLQFILGSAGSGKSYTMYHTVTREAERHPDDHYFVIVPEQFNMQTQKDLVSYSPNGGVLNIDIVSFPKLAAYVFEECGVDPGEVLTETGKNLLLRKAAEEIKDDLKMMKGRIDRPGYISQIKSILSEFGQYNITAGDLDEMIDLADKRPLLKEKLEDVAKIARAFDACKAKRYITSEEILKVLAVWVSHSKILRGAHLYFNEFTGFTPVQLLVMEELLKAAASVTIALTMDPAEGIPSHDRPHELFYLTGKTVHTLKNMAAHLHVEIKESILLSGQHRYAEGSGLANLERRLLRYRPSKAEGSSEGLHLTEAADPYEEVELCAARIWHLAYEENVRFSEIAVICADLSLYEKHIRRVFEEYGIPCFMDRKSSVKEHPCLEMLRSSIKLVEENWSYESVFHFLRLGYTSISEAEIDLLETYVLAAGIRGIARWKKPFDRAVDTLSEEQLLQCEHLRETLVMLLEPFAVRFGKAKAPVREYTEALRILMRDLQIQQKLQTYSESFREENEGASFWNLPGSLRRTMAMEYDQLYEIVDHILAEAESLLGEETVSRREFAQLFEAGIDEARVGVVPPGLDEIHVGDMIRTRLTKVKDVFLLGAVDGAIPSREDKSGIFSQMDRRFFEEHDIELAPDARANGFIQRFYLYQVLTKPSEALYVSCVQTNGNGETQHPSYLIHHLQKLFPDLPLENAKEVLASIDTPVVVFHELADEVRTVMEEGVADPRFKETFKHYVLRQDYAARTDMLLRAAGSEVKTRPIPADLTEGLYGQPLKLSVSRLESYAACPFRYFLNYGLKLRERSILTIKSADTGSFLHAAMKHFSYLVREEMDGDWSGLDAQTTEKLLQESLKRCFAEDGHSKDLFLDTSRSEYMLVRLLRALSRSVWAITKQNQAGKMTPVLFEVPFASDISLRGGQMATLSGVIDRIDLYAGAGELYVKVVDYKSSGKKINLNAFIQGQQLQLPVYLKEALKLLKKRYPEHTLIPAGVLYMQMADPLPSSQKDKLSPTSSEMDEEIMLKKLRPDGLIHDEDAVWSLMDETLVPPGTSRVIPMTLNADGSKRHYGNMRKSITEKEFESVMTYAEETTRTLSDEIMAGKIDIAPVEEGPNMSACTYCALKDVCGFDLRLPGCHYRRMPKFDKEKAWEMIMQGLRTEKGGEAND